MREKGKMLERDYNQNCALAHACDLLGERWTLLIVRDLLVSPRRFSELERRMRGMGTNLLSKRLKDMRSAGLIEGGDNRAAYRLTDMGQALEPIVLQMVRWGLRWVKSPARADGLHYPDWDLLALKALFVPDPKLKRSLTARFADGDWVGWVTINRQDYRFGLGEPDSPLDIDFGCGISTLARPARLLARLPEGQRGAAKMFMACFRRRP